MKKTLYYLAGFTAFFIAFTGLALAITPVPEPSTLAMLATGGGGVGAWLIVKARSKK